MCSICGIWGVDDCKAIDSMAASMHHRGPDDYGVYYDSSITLGATRLAISYVSPAGHQPMSNLAGTVLVVYNGETYSFQNERKLLEASGYSSDMIASQDYDLWWRLIQVTLLSNLQDVFFYLRKHEASVTSVHLAQQQDLSGQANG